MRPIFVVLAVALAAPAVAQTTTHIDVLGGVDYPDDCTGAIWVDGNTAYVARQHLGVAVLDVSDPARPVELAFIQPEADTTRFSVSDVHAADGRLYIANRVPNGTNLPTGIYVYDVANPAAPARIGEMTWGEGGGYHFGANVHGLWVDVTPQGAHHVYVASRTTGMIELFDFTDAAAPTYIITLNGSCDWSQYPNLPASCYEPRPGYAQDVVVRDGIAYAAMGDGGVLLFDVTHVAAPVDLAHVTWPTTYVRSLDLSPAGDVLYAVESRSTGFLRSLDVSVPAAPVELDTFRGRARAIPGRVAVDGDRLWLTHNEDGVYVLDAADPADLKLIAQYTPRAAAPNYGWVGHDGLFAGVGLAFVADSDTGFEALAVEQDTLTITKAIHRRGQQKLIVHVTSTVAPTALYGLAADGLGALTWKANKNRWQLVISGVADPGTVTVHSTLGASASRAVQSKR